jgi:hypothetical protein
MLYGRKKEGGKEGRRERGRGGMRNGGMDRGKKVLIFYMVEIQ